MPSSSMNRLVDHLRRLAVDKSEAPPTDGALLERFIAEQDETAFEALLRRHSAMVYGVCRRVVGDSHDAEDAFQATFLVLVRKAASVRPREAVGNWLYGVAFRTALEARTRRCRRQTRERQVLVLPQPAVSPETHWNDLWPVLDRELSALPEKYRLPVVLCDLEGRPRKQVARQLDLSEGTLSSRLATARKLLANRLSRRGITLSLTGLVAAFASTATAQAVPAALISTTTKTAILVAAGPMAALGVAAKVSTLTEGVLKIMLLAKLKTTAIVLAGVTAVGLGAGGLMYQARAGAPQPGDAEPQQAPQREAQRTDAQQSRQDRDSQARDREQLLREKLLEAEQARLRAEEMRRAADAARRQAEQALRQTRGDLKRLEAENRAAQRNRSEKSNQRADQSRDRENAARPPLTGGRPASANVDRSSLDQLQAKLRRQFDDQRRALEHRRQALEEQARQIQKQARELASQYRREAADLQKRLTDELQNRMKTTGIPPSPPRKSTEHAPSGDKLDRILERLDHLEKRLDRLEQRNAPPSRH